MTSPVNDEPAAEFSSPACFMRDADDSYMGYAGKDEVITFLNELLEAERAGARVALQSGRTAGSGPVAKLNAIQHDEARWCASRTVRTRLSVWSVVPHTSAVARCRTRTRATASASAAAGTRSNSSIPVGAPGHMWAGYCSHRQLRRAPACLAMICAGARTVEKRCTTLWKVARRSALARVSLGPCRLVGRHCRGTSGRGKHG